MFCCRPCRFSPACAGNSSSRRPPRTEPTMQPRVCGEQPPFPRATPCWSDRFSPACAGNRRPSAPQAGPSAVQPRVCGEQDVLTLRPTTTYGAALRVRGTGVDRAAGLRNDRCSPACAGNRRCICPRRCRCTVQPRVCGEQPIRAYHGSPHDGSAPRVRGTVHQDRQGGAALRFSPACAGNRSACVPAVSRVAVQPRVCGQQASTSLFLR